MAQYCWLGLYHTRHFWHVITGQWKQYIPTRKNFRAQINYYLLGIFQNAPHPTKKTQLSKLNPLQRVVYLALNVLVIPIMAGSGLLYMYYRYPNNPIALEGIEVVAILHTAGAFLVMVFIVVHVYLITTGQTLTSNLKAMITGFEEIEEDDETVPEPEHIEVNNQELELTELDA